jgi:hypothetical protein
MQKFFFISIHKPPASIRFAPIKHVLAVTVEPFKFSPPEPVAYELSHKTRATLMLQHLIHKLVNQPKITGITSYTPRFRTLAAQPA